ncbi:MAG TPA: hypothetical protein DCO68_12075 [Methylophilaceae bacterium]|nr:hypothetical protein [Methylophilaceae bacterium]HAJ72802.1 hypothetical protein [Methylophilaceae bacterium]
MKILNLTDFADRNWNWLKEEFDDPSLEWVHYPSQAIQLPAFIPKKATISRVVSAFQAVASTVNKPALLVSHGPRPALYGGNFAKIMNPDLPHLVYSFNFTNLPNGFLHKSMTKAFKQADRFVVYSTLEKQVYADYFDIPPESIDMLHWAVHAPQPNLSEPPVEQGEYICALGSQGRDYETLFAAMARLSNIKLVVVATQECIRHLSIPDNVKVYTNIPLTQAHNILMHSRFMALPLRDSEVPCGHVTIVSGMFFKKAIIVTDSKGVHDYITNEQTGLTFEPQNVDELAQKIQSLWENRAKTNTLAESGYAFAHQHCTHHNAVNYFKNFLSQINT